MITRWTTAAVAAIVMTASLSFAQTAPKAPTLKVGSPAPKVAVDKWIKGQPVTEFEDGKVYVVEFWATWCGPCIQSMPHLSKIQKKYADKGLTVISITSSEGGPSFDAMVNKVEKFVADKGDTMGYTVAIENPKTRKTATAYMTAAGQTGIPSAFIVDQTQHIAYIGHPMNPAFDKTLAKVIAGEYSAKETASVRQTGDAILQEASGMMEAGNFAGAFERLDDAIKLDSDIYGRFAAVKFQFLLAHEDAAIRDQDAALAYAKKVMHELAPKNAALQNEIAWMLVDFDETPAGAAPVAVELASSAAKISSWQDADILDTLAAAYFADSQHAKAVETQMKAIQLASAEQKAEFTDRLDAYKLKMAG